MKAFILAIIAIAKASNDIIVNPEGVPVTKALIIVPAPFFEPSDYKDLATDISSQGVVVAIPEMPKGNLFSKGYKYDYDCSGEIKRVLDQIAGVDSLVLAGHSWGGNVIQKFFKNNGASIKGFNIEGMIIMGSAIGREYVSINEDGTSKIANDIKTLTIAGELDGLMRISRVAESYYHGSLNINKDQQNKFDFKLIKGMTHAQFASRSEMPDFIKQNDLVPEISNAEAAGQLSDALKAFVLGDTFGDEDYFMPLVDAMEQEGYYNLKPACYDSEFVNPKVPTCLSGSPWVENNAHQIMADNTTFKNPNVKIAAYDNFHRASSVTPVHHPVLNGSCTLEEETECIFEAYSVTENSYNSLNDFTKLEKFQVAALEQRSKLNARQVLRKRSGEKDADFHVTDEIGDRCKEINQASYDWALAHTDKSVRERYENHGEKMVQAADRNTLNGGLWIIDPIFYTEKDDKSEVDVAALAYRMSDAFPVPMFAGQHYCKILSPFKAMEWIYVDSLYAKKSLSAPEDPELFMQ